MGQSRCQRCINASAYLDMEMNPWATASGGFQLSPSSSSVVRTTQVTCGHQPSMHISYTISVASISRLMHIACESSMDYHVCVSFWSWRIAFYVMNGFIHVRNNVTLFPCCSILLVFKMTVVICIANYIDSVN